MKEFFSGVAVTVLGGLILYFIFGIGKEKRAIPLKRALKIELENNSPTFNIVSRDQDGLANNFSVMIRILIRNLSNKNIAIRNSHVSLETPNGYESGLFNGDLGDPVNIGGENFLSIYLLFSVKIAGAWNGGANSQNIVWEENRQKALASINNTRIKFNLTAEAVSSDNSISVDKTFDITAAIMPQIRT